MSARALVLLLAAAAVCGCGSLPSAPPAAGLVGYFAAVSRQGPSGQKQALAQAAQSFGRDPTPIARLRLGGLHAQPAPALRDDARALSLLEPLLAPARDPAGTDPAIADLAALLHAQVAERQRAARDEAKKLDALREQNEAMKERFGALRALDRSILQREDRQPHR